MTGWLRHTIWFARLVILAGALLLAAIGSRFLVNPAAAGAPNAIVFGSPAALTIGRVGLGGFPLAMTIILLACLATGRLLVGLGVLGTVLVVVTAVRIAGLVVDGAAPFTVHVLRPEIALSSLSIAAAALELTRRRRVRPVSDAS